MEERTRAYLRGRFRDYYRRASVTTPPGAERREWGYIPWTEGPDTTMVRHRSLLDLGNLEEFLERERPRHVYFSAGYYEDPSARTMQSKHWQGSDLVFDLDADHLPNVTLGEDSYAEMLSKCKDALLRLVDLLERDFGYDDLTIAFSGGRGYHVHVRDERVQQLERNERREIVDYLRGNGLTFDSITVEQAVGGLGLKNPTTRKSLPTDGGWSPRFLSYLEDFITQIESMERDEAVARIQEYDGIGQQRAENAYRNLIQRKSDILSGKVDLHESVRKLLKELLPEAVAAQEAPIDEPVTTDTNRLIRFPGTLHGGSGLEVLRLTPDELDAFDPLTDAVPETFVGHEIQVDVERSYTLEFFDETLTVEPGVTTLPEYAGIFLMARGWAEKAKE